MGAAWKEQRVRKTKGSSLCKHSTAADAVLFAIGMVTKNLVSTLRKADHSLAEIVTESRVALVVTADGEKWALRTVTSIRR
jgi:hypothetical protein